MGYRFNAPPNWPEPPSADWLPPLGWKPDAVWSPAPDTWNFWVEDPTFASQPSPAGGAALPTAGRKNWLLHHKVTTSVGAVLLLGVFMGITTHNPITSLTAPRGYNNADSLSASVVTRFNELAAEEGIDATAISATCISSAPQTFNCAFKMSYGSTLIQAFTVAEDGSDYMSKNQ